METGKVQWTDAGPFLERVCADLSLGELIHGENFSLFEAMSALEIMDPKMDAEMATAGFCNADEAIAAGVAPIDLSLPQILDVMDHLMACEATWHDGSSLAQTVFTCIYLLDVDHTSPNSILHAHCKAVRATCNTIRTLACKADVREEEDFVTASFGLPLEGDTDSKSLAGLLAVEELFSRKLKAVKEGASKQKSRDGQAESIAIEDEPTLNPELCRALLCRIRFRKALFYALTNMEKPQGRGIELAKKHLASALAELSVIRATTSQMSKSDVKSEDKSPIASSSTSLTPPLSSPDNSSKFSTLELKEPSSQALSESDVTTSLHTNGQLPSEKNGNCGVDLLKHGGSSTASGRIAVGFDEMINRSLLSPTPPRPMRILSWLETLDRFEKLLCDLERVCSCPLAGSLQELQQFLVDVQDYLPGPIARCHLQQLVLQWGQSPQDGKATEEPASAAIFQTLRLPFEKELRKDTSLGWFTFKAKQVELKLLRSLTGNLSRQRRELAKLLTDWNGIIQEAEVAGGSTALAAFVSSNYSQSWWADSLLISWSGEQACRSIWHYLMLGFHTQLYAASEYCGIFWYLDHVLSTLLHNVEAREKAWWERQHRQTSGTDSGKDKKSRRKKGAPASISKERIPPFQGSVDLALIRCHLDLCKALVRMLVALSEDKKLQFPTTPYNSEQERFEQRVEVLGRAPIPEPMTYAAYQRGTDICGLTVVEVYQMAYELFQAMAVNVQRLKERMEQESDLTVVSKKQRLADVQRMGQVAARNCLALQVAHRAGPGPSLKVSFDFSLHPCFPVTVLKRS